MKDAAQVYADRLEQQEAAEGSAESLYDCLRTVGEPSFLLEIAATVAPYAGIAQAIYRRALEIGVAEETARAYLAQSHLFLGNTEEARKLVEPGVETSTDPLRLGVWAALGSSPDAVLRRLDVALRRVPMSVVLWRQLGTAAIQAANLELARTAHLRLRDLEDDPDELARVREILAKYGWDG